MYKLFLYQSDCFAGSRETLTFAAKIDSLSMTHRDIPVGKLYEILVESSVRYLKLLEATLLKKIDCEDIRLFMSLPEVFHFFPEFCDHFITTIYCNNDSEKTLSEQKDWCVCFFLLQLLFVFRSGKRAASQTAKFAKNTPTF